MKEIVVHQVDISHSRLEELIKLADQAEPFYQWVERKFKIYTGSHKSLNEILHELPKDKIKEAILICITDTTPGRPFLFDGIGRTYPHKKACFYFFAWLIRDAPQQRLAPLIQRMARLDDISKIEAEVDTLASLLFEYRGIVKDFTWLTLREVVLDRLEGSRRSIKGHRIETLCRTALIIAFQNYYQTHGNYGVYDSIDIPQTQIKVGSHTFDLSVKLQSKSKPERLFLMPIKTRETEGGGHAHLFSRDIVTAISETRQILPDSVIVAVIVARNWSAREITGITDLIDQVYHFDSNPNRFTGFTDSLQARFNLFVQEILDGK